MSKPGLFQPRSLAWLTAAIACSPAAPPDSPYLTELVGQPALEVFDLRAADTRPAGPPPQHWRVVWDGASSQAAVAALASWLTEDALVTVVTWPGSPDGGMQAMADGTRDEEIGALCQALAPAAPQVYLRWNPEMEVPAGLHPWQNQAPGTYITAFRRLSGACRREAPGVKLVWGPAGYPGDLEYFPGAAAVDLVSVTIDSPSEARVTAYPRPDSLADRLRAKLHRLRFLDKPVLILAGSSDVAAAYRRTTLAAVRERMLADRQTVYAGDLVSDPDRDKWRRGDAPIRLGVYDPRGRLTRHPAVSIKHVFIDWRAIGDGWLRRTLRGIAGRGHDAIVTLEPWNGPENERDPDLLRNLVRGRYDGELRGLFAILAAAERTVYLRFAHEMEIPVDRYPWQRQDPAEYIHAFRYVARFARPRPPQVRLVWGPAGDRGSLAWWPGADVVDYLSVAIYGLPDRDITDHRLQEQFQAILERKLHRMRFVDKPVLITEFGVKGPQDYQRAWLGAAARTIRDNPQIVGVCYFNLEDLPGAWGEIAAPDWSIGEAVFNAFTRELLGRPRPVDGALLRPPPPRPAGPD